jgi:hypothetical protein
LPDIDAYSKNSDGSLKVKINSNRIIEEKDCQYYIDFTNPNLDYVEPNEDNNSDAYGLYLPDGFSVYEPGPGAEYDSSLSSWYRGARYGYAQ